MSKLDKFLIIILAGFILTALLRPLVKDVAAAAFIAFLLVILLFVFGTHIYNRKKNKSEISVSDACVRARTERRRFYFLPKRRKTLRCAELQVFSHECGRRGKVLSRGEKKSGGFRYRTRSATVEKRSRFRFFARRKVRFSLFG